MKLSTYVTRGIVFLICLSIGAWFLLFRRSVSTEVMASTQNLNSVHIITHKEEEMMRLIRKQNETISRMTTLLHDAASTVSATSSTIGTESTTSSSRQACDCDDMKREKTEKMDTSTIVKGAILHDRALEMAKMDKELESKNIEIMKLKGDLEKLQQGHESTYHRPLPESSQPARSAPPKSKGGALGDLCEVKYGFHLVGEWRKSKQTWCEGVSSSIQCYPYQQRHKKLDGRGPDMFCVGENVYIDFSKVEGSVNNAGGRSKLTNYLKYRDGSLFSKDCKKTGQWNARYLMPHHAAQMASFADSTASASITTDDAITEELTTYLLARDEDCENSFHSTADFTNMHLVANILDVDPANQQVMLWDRHKDGPYTDLISKAFAGGRKLLRNDHYGQKKVLFKKLIFHLESPAGLIFPKVARPGQLRCKSTWLFTSYAQHVLQSFGLWDTPPPAIPHATLLVRNRTPTKNVGRIMSNPQEVEAVLREGNMMTHQVVDTAQLPFVKQLELIRQTNILIGVHGAGLMLILFAADEAVLLEIHPSYRQDRHFRHASRMVGHTYIPIRSRTRETCQGSSDNVLVPIPEFRSALDAALRVARQHDNGISECGLQCPGEILALDKALVPYYAKAGMRPSPSVNTRFPCG